MQQITIGAALLFAIGALGSAGGCSGGDGPAEPCASAQTACELSATLSDITVAPGEEIVDLCQSWTLNNPHELWVTRVDMENQGIYHHSNWFFVPDDLYDVPDGAWPCADNDFSQLNAAIQGGYLFAQTTQSRSEVQEFAGGAAVRVPPYSRVIGNTHLLNATDGTATTRMSLRLTSAPAQDVTVKLVPGRIEYQSLVIPPHSKAEFTAECDIAGTYQATMNAPMRYSIYHVLPHYHALGTYFQFELLGGPRAGEVLYRHDGYGGDTFGKTFDPPLDLVAAGATGIRFTCGFENPRADEVRWGVGDQEMCVTAIFADSDMGFDGDVEENTVIGTTAGGTIQNTGRCALLGVPWSHDRRGGPPRLM